MILRALALLSALAVPLLLTIDPIAQLHPAMFWIGPLAAILAAVPIVLAAKETRTQALFGAALAAMAAASTPGLPRLLAMTGSGEGLPVFDLRDSEGLIPEGSEGYVALVGYLQRDWVVDEYAVAEGQRPDQDEAPKAVLMPMVASAEPDAVTTLAKGAGSVVVVRVDPDRVKPTLVTLRGRLGPVDEQIVESLFMIQYEGGEPGQGAVAGVAEPPPAILLDTFDIPSRGQALTRAGLALGAALLGLVLLLLAIPKPSEAKGAGGRAPAEG